MRTSFALTIAIAFGSPAHAASTHVLPSGVRSFAVRSAYVDGMENAYGSNGRLSSLGDSKSMTFDAVTLAKVNDQARNLIDALNAIGSQNLGSQLNLGTLRVHTKPQLAYIAPTFAYGLSKRWTVGVGLPVVQYSNRVRLSAEGSNLESYRNLGLTGFSSQLDQALNIDLVTEVEKLIAQRGYKALKSREETFFGDIQLAALYQLHRGKKLEVLYQTTLSLPTGPANDPDDLLAPNLFARTSLENSINIGWRAFRKVTFVPYASVLVYAPDRVRVRAPASVDDVLPAAEQTRTVQRELGLTSRVGSEATWTFNSEWSTVAGIDFMKKAADNYKGPDQELRYDLLSKDTDSQAVTLKTGLSYSSVAKFKRKQTSVPTLTSFEISDIVSGVNVIRQLKAELSLMVFF